LVPKVSKVVVIGGGILGLEAAWQLKLLGLPVTVLEVAPLLMMRQLDEASSLHLRKISEAKGLIIHTGVQISEIKTENNWANAVVLQDGRSFDADLIIVSAGVKASTELAKQLGVTLGRAIIVDETMRTSVPDVFAAGDCAEFKGINYAIWPQALDQGKVAGANAAGDELVYQTIVPAVSMHALDTPLYAIGDPGKDPNRTYTQFESEDGLISSRYFFSEDVLVGGVLFGNIDQSIALMEGIEQKQSKEAFLKSLK
jgi:NAD(P)H-nitrite reductase large subunit